MREKGGEKKKEREKRKREGGGFWGGRGAWVLTHALLSYLSCLFATGAHGEETDKDLKVHSTSYVKK